MAEQQTTPKMKIVRLGTSGLKVSEICLGAMNFGAAIGTDEETSFKILDRFAELGGNFIDIANIYGTPKGNSEVIVGKWLATKKRSDFIIATKCRYAMSSNPQDTGASRKHIMTSIEESLTRLQTSYIDLYQIHGFDKEVPLEETLSALSELIRNGKVRYIGVSNYRGYQLQKAYQIAKELRIDAYICLQVQYSLMCREVEWEVLEVARLLGMGIIPWSPLKGGWLTGKYTRDMTAPPASTRIDFMTKAKWKEMEWEENATESTWKILDVLKEVATKLGKSQSQVALRWLLQQPGVTAPIVGPRTLEQAEDNFQVFDWKIPEEDMKKLTDVSKPKAPYPYSWESTSAF